MLDVAGKRMTGKDKPLKLDEGIQIANDIVARNEPGEKLEWAKRYLLTVASVKAASTATANTPTISLPSTVETGKPVNNATPAEKLSQLLGKSVATGEFGADMKVQLINDGPVTIYMDTKNKE